MKLKEKTKIYNRNGKHLPENRQFPELLQFCATQPSGCLVHTDPYPTQLPETKIK